LSFAEGDSAPLGTINTAATRGGDEIHSRRGRAMSCLDSILTAQDAWDGAPVSIERGRARTGAREQESERAGERESERERERERASK